MKTHALAVALCTMLIGVVGGLLWLDHSRMSKTHMPSMEHDRVTPPIKSPAPEKIAQARGVFKCEMRGRTIYQDLPCKKGQTPAPITTKRLTVADPHPVRPPQARPAPPTPSQRSRAQRTSESAAGHCPQLFAQKERIQEAQRRGQSGESMNRLNSRLRHVQHQIGKLRCERFSH